MLSMANRIYHCNVLWLSMIGFVVQNTDTDMGRRSTVIEVTEGLIQCCVNSQQLIQTRKRWDIGLLSGWTSCWWWILHNSICSRWGQSNCTQSVPCGDILQPLLDHVEHLDLGFHSTRAKIGNICFWPRRLNCCTRYILLKKRRKY